MTTTGTNTRQDHRDDPYHHDDMSPITASRDGWGFAWQLAKREMRGSLGRFQVFLGALLLGVAARANVEGAGLLDDVDRPLPCPEVFHDVGGDVVDVGVDADVHHIPADVMEDLWTGERSIDIVQQSGALDIRSSGNAKKQGS